MLRSPEYPTSQLFLGYVFYCKSGSPRYHSRVHVDFSLNGFCFWVGKPSRRRSCGLFVNWFTFIILILYSTVTSIILSSYVLILIYSIYSVRGIINRARWLKVIWLSRSHPLKWFSHCNIDESFDRKLILHSILYSLLSPFLKNIRHPKYQRGLQK